ncbi:MAG: type II toxin-antitoxin system VapC family toxin [Phycisphaerae bacterium]
MFLDAGAVIAWERRDDKHHSADVGAWDRLRVSPERLLTTSLVLAEVSRALMWLKGPEAAVRRHRSLLKSPMLEVFRPPKAAELQALELMKKYGDNPIGFVDCVSFVVMRERRLTRAFGFDRHFITAGFQVWPGSS